MSEEKNLIQFKMLYISPTEFIEIVEVKDKDKDEDMKHMEGAYGKVIVTKWNTKEKLKLKVAQKLMMGYPDITEGEFIEEIDEGLKEDFKKEFAKECLLQCSLKDSTIIRSHGWTIIDKSLSIVMEYMEGKSLQYGEFYSNIFLYLETIKWNILLIFSVIDNYQIRYCWTFAVDSFLQVAKGLRYLHERKLIHKDIKPSNLLFDEIRQTVKIGDFGTLSRYSLNEGKVRGTELFLEPGVILGQVATYSRKSDVYSWGLSLWSFLTRYPPFAEYDNVDFENRGNFNAFQTDIEIYAENDKISAFLNNLVKKCTLKERESRYSSKGLVECLENFIQTCENFLVIPFFTRNSGLCDFVKKIVFQ